MNADAAPQPDRLFDLLADRAVQGLSEADARELDRLLASSPAAETDSMDLAAAAAYLAIAAADSGVQQSNPAATITVEPMPASVRERIAAGAMRRLRDANRGHTPGRRAGLDESTSPPPVPQQRPYRRTEPPPQDAPPARGARTAWMGYTGWAAAATLLAVAAAGWWTGRGDGQGGAPAAASPVELRERLLMAHADGAVRAGWIDPADRSACPGDVVWHTGRQEGYIRVASLPVNDPRKEQYQLWIIDPAHEHPIDGGVFDVPGPGEVVVPIRAGRPVAAPAAFAVTIEQPGGVAVSDRARLPLLAEIGR